MRLSRGLSIILILSQGACASAPVAVHELSPITQIPVVNQTPLDYADLQLRDSAFSEPFIQSLHQHFITSNQAWKDQVKRIVELNVFGFLAHSDYSVHDTPKARKHISAYLKAHRQSFRDARKAYAVSSSSIASLMWVETKYGKVLGTYPVAWVYYGLILGSHPDFIKEMLELLPAKMARENPKNLSLVEAQKKVIERCKSKSVWALDEMKAVRFISESHSFDPLKTKASFAGAFGLGQFIPSSYLKFSVSRYRKNADLFKHSDAILSIAHFLIENGWVESDPESKAKALYSYNRSKDYGAIILKLASEVKSSSH